MSSEMENDDAGELEEEEELEKLEEEVEKLSETIQNYRNTLPDKLSAAMASVLASQRPLLPDFLDPESGPTQGPVREIMDISVTEDPQDEEAEKMQLLKKKILSNASTLPVVLNRMKEYMARIDKIESSNETIHPAFKRKRTS